MKRVSVEIEIELLDGHGETGAWMFRTIVASLPIDQAGVPKGQADWEFSATGGGLIDQRPVAKVFEAAAKMIAAKIDAMEETDSSAPQE